MQAAIERLRGPNVLKFLAWFWFVNCVFGSMALAATGEPLGCIVMFASGLFAFPPLWKWAKEKGIDVPTWARWIGGLVAFIVGTSFLPQSNSTSINASLSSLEAKVGENAVIEMQPDDYADTFERLGEDAFARANDLAKWPAIKAASTSNCDQVDLVAISDQATSDALVWFVDCANGERIFVSEPEATEMRDHFAARPERKPASNSQPKPTSSASSAPKQEKKSFEFDARVEALVVGSCDDAIKATLTNKRSFDPTWSYDYRTDRSTGRASLMREFDADNAFGGTISSRYECIVQADKMELISLKVREPTGWKTLYSQ